MVCFQATRIHYNFQRCKYLLRKVIYLLIIFMFWFFISFWINKWTVIFYRIGFKKIWIFSFSVLNWCSTGCWKNWCYARLLYLNSRCHTKFKCSSDNLLIFLYSLWQFSNSFNSGFKLPLTLLYYFYSELIRMTFLHFQFHKAHHAHV